jgi:hypothetical protein
MKALIPKLVDAMERRVHLELDPVVNAKLLRVSAATIDRMLANARLHIDGQRKRSTGVVSAIRRSVPVRTFADWRDPPPGFFEIDMVEHYGGLKSDGEFVHTLTLSRASRSFVSFSTAFGYLAAYVLMNWLNARSASASVAHRTSPVRGPPGVNWRPTEPPCQAAARSTL